MRPLSNITTIARAAEYVCKQVPEAVFVFTAPGEQRDSKYENEVRDILNANGLQDRARFVKAIPHDEIADYYRLAAVTVLIPSTDGTPLTALESMACGTPVVCGDIPDYDAKYFENGKTVLMADIADSSSVADAIVALLKQDELAANLASEAHARVVKFGSYESQMSRMEQLYQGIMQ